MKFRNACLIFTLAIFATASALATPVTRAHKRAPALTPVRKQSHTAYTKSSARSASAKSRNAGSASATSAAGRRATTRSAAPRTQAANGLQNRAQNRNLPRSIGRTSVQSASARPQRETRTAPQVRYAPAVRRRFRREPVPQPETESAPDPRVEIASLNTESMTLPSTRHASSRVVSMPAPLKGSLESLERQNERTEGDGLERILDEQDLQDRIDQKLLVPVPVSVSLSVNNNLAETHRYVRPWTAIFLEDISKAHAQRFDGPIQVTSAVRTVEYQKQLRLVNGNATEAEGDIVSPHLTGATIDIGKNTMSRAELAWMRNFLLPLQLDGKIDVEEEFRQACFHITVYKSYVPPPAPAASLASTRKAHSKASEQAASTDGPR
ncbi:DUF5715 family protein [Terracidiphilus sp.]|uniref:DUF5715 family protein n=1 Tax=Terracidiphilus sp. TaxID=1964191 RepID=UPI003C20F3A4